MSVTLFLLLIIISVQTFVIIKLTSAIKRVKIKAELLKKIIEMDDKKNE